MSVNYLSANTNDIVAQWLNVSQQGKKATTYSMFCMGVLKSVW